MTEIVPISHPQKRENGNLASVACHCMVII